MRRTINGAILALLFAAGSECDGNWFIDRCYSDENYSSYTGVSTY